jgi:putative intracellular protease/amidase
MTKTNMDLSELLAKHDQGDFLRSIAEAVLQLDTSKYRLILVFGGWGRLARALAVPSVH